MSATRSGLRETLRAFAQGGALSVVRLVAGFGRTKYIAFVLGPFGVGILSQANQLNLLAISLCSLSMAVGIINRFAAAREQGDEERAARVLGTALAVQASLSAFLVLIGLFQASRISSFVYEAGQPLWSALILCGTPFAVGASGFLEGLLFGSRRYDLYVRASLIATVLGVAIQLVLIHYAGLIGAFIGYPINSIILFVSFLVHARKCRPLRRVFVLHWDPTELRPLLAFSFSVMINSTAAYGVALLVRRFVIARLGAEGNGLIQVPIALSAYFAPFVTNGLWGQLHPLVSAQGDSSRAREELGRALEISALLALAYAFGVTILRPVLVWLAYSKSFEGALPIMPVQCAADYFYFIAFTTSVYLLGTRQIVIYVAGWLSYYAAFVSGSLTLLPRMELYAVPIGHALGSTGCAGVALIFLGVTRRIRAGTCVGLIAGGATVTLEALGGTLHSVGLQLVAVVLALALVLSWWRFRSATLTIREEGANR